MSHPYSIPRATPFGSRALQRQMLATVLVAAGLASGAVHAADKPLASDAKSGTKPAAAKRVTPAPAPAPKPIQPLLSRDELRACMNLQASNKEHAADVQQMQPEIVAEKAELQRSGEAMKAELAALDRSNLDAVKAYNERAAARDRQITQLESKIADFNAKVTAFDSGREAYGRDCENRKYDEKDEKALLKQ